MEKIVRKAGLPVTKAIGAINYLTSVVNLDFHTIPHFGDESVLQEHWAGARNKTMKGARTLFAQDAGSKLLVYAAADIKRDESDEQMTQFLSYWKKINRGLLPTLVFDSRFTSYGHLSELNSQGVKFIAVRRRGSKLLKSVDNLQPWSKILIPHAKRKFPNPLVHQSTIRLQGYARDLRQVVIRGNGQEKPAFLVSNDFDTPVELLVGNYSRRWRVENAISEAVDFFNLNSLSSPILGKVHFDVIMTMIADTLYHVLAVILRGFEHCDTAKLFRNFVRGKGVVPLRDEKLVAHFPSQAHNPVLRSVPWNRLPAGLPWLNGAQLQLDFD